MELAVIQLLQASSGSGTTRLILGGWRMASLLSRPQSKRKSVVYTEGVDEVGKESASEYSSIGKATEEILEKHPPGASF